MKGIGFLCQKIKRYFQKIIKKIFGWWWHSHTHLYPCPRLISCTNTYFFLTFTGAFFSHACGVTRNLCTYFFSVRRVFLVRVGRIADYPGRHPGVERPFCRVCFVTVKLLLWRMLRDQLLIGALISNHSNDCVSSFWKFTLFLLFRCCRALCRIFGRSYLDTPSVRRKARVMLWQSVLESWPSSIPGSYYPVFSRVCTVRVPWCEQQSSQQLNLPSQINPRAWTPICARASASFFRELRILT